MLSKFVFFIRTVALASILANLTIASTQGEPVAWQQAKGIQGDADISRLGTPVDAVQGYVGKASTDVTLGDTTFHAIQVNPTSATTYQDGTISIATASPVQFFAGQIRVTPDAKAS